MVPLARKTLVHEWRRFLPAIVAVGFAGLLLLLQAALVLGIFSSAGIYVTASTADLWMGAAGTQSVSLGRSFAPEAALHAQLDPDVVRGEPLYWVDGSWHGRPGSGAQIAYVIGIATQPGSLAFARLLSPALRARLAQPDGVVIDRADQHRLGVEVGDRAWINGRRVQVVGATSGLRALGGANVLTSLETAQRLEPDPADAGRPTYFLLQLKPDTDPRLVAGRLRNQAGFGPYEVWTARGLASRSVRYWLLETGAGAGVLFLAAIVFLVGAIITSQTLMGAIAGSLREYATLNALGISMRKLRHVVLEQAFWVAALGLVLAATLGAAAFGFARMHDVPVAFDLVTAVACLLAVLLLAMVSGLVAARSLRRADPASLLR